MRLVSLISDVWEKGEQLSRGMDVRFLQFDEYLLAVEQVAEGVVDEDEGEGVGHRGPFQGRNDGMEDGVDGVVDAETGEEDGEQLAEDIEGEGVHTEDLELGVHDEASGGVAALQPDKEGEQQGGQATGDEHVAGTPDALVQGQGEGEQIAGDDADGACDEEALRLVACSGILLEQHAAEEAYEHMGDAGDGAQQSLGIHRTLMVQVVVAEKAQVGLCYDIR